MESFSLLFLVASSAVSLLFAIPSSECNSRQLDTFSSNRQAAPEQQQQQQQQEKEDEEEEEAVRVIRFVRSNVPTKIDEKIDSNRQRRSPSDGVEHRPGVKSGLLDDSGSGDLDDPTGSSNNLSTSNNKEDVVPPAVAAVQSSSPVASDVIRLLTEDNELAGITDIMTSSVEQRDVMLQVVSEQPQHKWRQSEADKTEPTAHITSPTVNDYWPASTSHVNVNIDNLPSVKTHNKFSANQTSSTQLPKGQGRGLGYDVITEVRRDDVVGITAVEGLVASSDNNNNNKLVLVVAESDMQLSKDVVEMRLRQMSSEQTVAQEVQSSLSSAARTWYVCVWSHQVLLFALFLYFITLARCNPRYLRTVLEAPPSE